MAGPRALRSFCLMWALPDPCLQTRQTWGWGGCWGLSRGLLQSDSNPPPPGCCRLGAREPPPHPRPKEAGLPCSSLMPARPCVLGVQLLELGSTLRPPRPPHSLQRPPGEAGFPGVAGDPLPPPSPCPHHLHSRQLQTAHLLSPGCAARRHRGPSWSV